MEEVSLKENDYNKTISLSRLLNRRVISKKGQTVGRVSQVRVNSILGDLAGIVVKRKPHQKPFYIGKNYIDRFSTDSILLKIEPSPVLRGKKVLSYQGENLGRVLKVIRVEKGNDIKELVVYSPLRGKFIVKPSQIYSKGESIILKHTYHEPKKAFWNIFR